MQDDPDPPRKFYGLKPKEFERVNAGTPPPAEKISADPGIVPADTGPIDVNDLIRSGAGNGPALGWHKVANRENEIHGILRDNLARANAAGLNEVLPMTRKYRRRRRDYLVLIIGGNLFIAVVYAVEMFIGFQVQSLAAKMPNEFSNLVRFALHTPTSYAMALVGMVFFSGCLTWLMYGIMDDY
jgi:hypothetical protein